MNLKLKLKGCTNVLSLFEDHEASSYRWLIFPKENSADILEDFAQDILQFFRLDIYVLDVVLILLVSRMSIWVSSEKQGKMHTELLAGHENILLPYIVLL